MYMGLFGYWVILTSGGIDTKCRARWGKYKNMKIRMNKMSIVYASKNQHYALEMEKIQIDYWFRQVISNRTRGGGGRYAAIHKIPFVVYIAWREWAVLNTHRLHARNCISEPRTVTLNGYSLTHSLSECTNSGPDQIRTTMSYWMGWVGGMQGMLEPKYKRDRMNKMAESISQDLLWIWNTWLFIFKRVEEARL